MSTNDLVLKLAEKIERFTKKRFKLTKCRKPESIFINEIDSLHMNSDIEGRSSVKVLFLTQGRSKRYNSNMIPFFGTVKMSKLLASIIHRQLKKPILISFSGNYVHFIIFEFHSANVLQTLAQQNLIKVSSKKQKKN